MRRGSANPNWRGGITPANRAARQTPEYKAWRLAVFIRDGYQCVWCGRRGTLHADHIKPFSTHPDLRLDINNGRTLCVECHRTTTTYLSGALRGRYATGFGVPRKTHCPCGRPYDFREKNNSPRCRACRSKQAKDRYQARKHLPEVKQKYREESARYRAANKMRRAASGREYYRRNRDAILLRRRATRALLP